MQNAANKIKDKGKVIAHYPINSTTCYRQRVAERFSSLHKGSDINKRRKLARNAAQNNLEDIAGWGKVFLRISRARSRWLTMQKWVSRSDS
jgi:hypothetical protein